MNLLALHTTNDFIYNNVVYKTPFFLINYNNFSDLYYINLNNFMYLSYDCYLVGNSYLESFGMSLNYENTFSDEFILKNVSQFLLTISPNTNFVEVQINK